MQNLYQSHDPKQAISLAQIKYLTMTMEGNRSGIVQYRRDVDSKARRQMW